MARKPREIATHSLTIVTEPGPLMQARDEKGRSVIVPGDDTVRGICSCKSWESGQRLAIEPNAEKKITAQFKLHEKQRIESDTERLILERAMGTA